MHLYWTLPGGICPVREASVDLEVLVPPRTPNTVFWALQASFTDATGTAQGAAHLGLQWYPPHPRSRAVNWGGYPPEHGNWQKTLIGSESELPSTTNDPNTRDYTWEQLRPYRLVIAPSPDQGWRGSVTDVGSGVTTVVRDLWLPGDRLTGLVVWTEPFGPCNDPSSAVRWSRFSVVTDDGATHLPESLTVNQPPTDKCRRRAHIVEQDGPDARVQQILNAKPVTPHGSIITVGAGAGSRSVWM